MNDAKVEGYVFLAKELAEIGMDRENLIVWRLCLKNNELYGRKMDVDIFYQDNDEP